MDCISCGYLGVVRKLKSILNLKMRKSPIDELFFELYGFYPNKAGSAYEIIVASAIKIITGDNIKYNQHLKGVYSESDYQLDGLNIDKKQMIEAKDYTINKKKVGRDDLQKLQGALSDLDVEKGIFASATDYTKPAKKYSESSGKNPLHKEIELYNIRESTELDEKGRINKFVITLSMITPDFKSGQMNFAWTRGCIIVPAGNLSSLTGCCRKSRVKLNKSADISKSVDTKLPNGTSSGAAPLHKSIRRTLRMDAPN